LNLIGRTRGIGSVRCGTLPVRPRRHPDRDRFVHRQIHRLVRDEYAAVKMGTDRLGRHAIMDVGARRPRPRRGAPNPAVSSVGPVNACAYRSSSAATTLIEPRIATTSASMWPSVSLAITW